MINLPPGVELEIIWFDEDMIELRIRSSNHRYAGQTSFYAGFGSPKEFADRISGFPTSAADRRVYEFRGADLAGYGDAKFDFSSIDSRGHCILAITVHENSLQFPGNIQSVGLIVPFDPASLDSFVEQLNRMEVRVGDRAFLAMAT